MPKASNRQLRSRDVEASTRYRDTSSLMTSVIRTTASRDHVIVNVTVSERYVVIMTITLLPWSAITASCCRHACVMALAMYYWWQRHDTAASLRRPYYFEASLSQRHAVVAVIMTFITSQWRLCCHHYCATINTIATYTGHNGFSVITTITTTIHVAMSLLWPCYATVIKCHYYSVMRLS